MYQWLLCTLETDDGYGRKKGGTEVEKLRVMNFANATLWMFQILFFRETLEDEEYRMNLELSYLLNLKKSLSHFQMSVFFVLPSLG